MASRKHPRDQYRPPVPQETEGQHPCSRQPPELCDGARIVATDAGASRREPAFTPRAYCEACESRITSCLEEMPSAYVRLAERIGDPVRAGKAVRVMPGSRVLVSPDIDALMREMASVLGGWAARVRSVPGLQLTDPDLPPDDPEAIEDACVKVMARHVTPLLALQGKWAHRTFTFPVAAPAPGWVAWCKHCKRKITPGKEPAPGLPPRWWLAEKGDLLLAGCEHQPDRPAPDRPDVIPADVLEAIGDREIVRQGDGWVTVLDWRGGVHAGNEILNLHWKARRILGETRTQPESFDGVPCRNCDEIALERAEPPSDPSLPAMHSKCAACKDEMDREEFAQWAERYAGWARGAGIRICRRCSLAEPRHEDCAWAACSCTEGEHPRRRAVA